MPSCHIVPSEWSPCCGELRFLWNRWAKRGQLIDLDTARAYFVPTLAEIDLTSDPPTIRQPEPHRYM